MKAKQQRIQQILSETIMALCNNGLEFDCELEIDGLLGITLDKKDVFLVKISEIVQGGKSTLSPKPQFKDSASELTVENDLLDNNSMVNVPAKRLCTQLRTNRSPKRKKPEDDDNDDNASPQDLSQRTHSPCTVKQELFSNADSNHRDSSSLAASVVRIASPAPNSFSNNSHWRPDQMDHEDNSQPLVFLRKHSPLSLKPLGVLSLLPPRSELLSTPAAAAPGERTRHRSAAAAVPDPRFLSPTPPPLVHHRIQASSLGAAASNNTTTTTTSSALLHPLPTRNNSNSAAASATVSSRRRHKSSPDCLPPSAATSTYAAKLDVNFRRETSKKVLTRAEEKFLVDWVFEKSVTRDGVTVPKVLREVKSWLDAECRDTNYDDNLPNEEWFREFLRRHPELYAIKWWN